jgi:uncharacterized DUF497 family protein
MKTAPPKINYQKHGVSFMEAATIFSDPLAITCYDQLNSQNEDRFITIGYSDRYRLLVVVHTERDYNTRIISARTASNKEKKNYESNQELDRKLAIPFPGRVVRKDLVKKLKVGFNVPVYVLEYLLGKYCSTTKETEIQAGLEQVKTAITERIVLL